MRRLKPQYSRKILLSLIELSGKSFGMTHRENRHRIVGIAGRGDSALFKRFLLQAHREKTMDVQSHA